LLKLSSRIKRLIYKETVRNINRIERMLRRRRDQAARIRGGTRARAARARAPR
jgi:hypothetical protein